MDEFQRIREHLQKAEAILLALNSDAAPASALHACKIHIWKALDDLSQAEAA